MGAYVLLLIAYWCPHLSCDQINMTWTRVQLYVNDAVHNLDKDKKYQASSSVLDHLSDKHQDLLYWNLHEELHILIYSQMQDHADIWSPCQWRS